MKFRLNVYSKLKGIPSFSESKLGDLSEISRAARLYHMKYVCGQIYGST